MCAELTEVACEGQQKKLAAGNKSRIAIRFCAKNILNTALP